MSDETPPTVIDQNAAGPRRVQTESGSVEQHSLPDQIAADLHRRRIAASRNPFGCLRTARAAFAPTTGPNAAGPIPGSDMIWRP